MLSKASQGLSFHGELNKDSDQSEQKPMLSESVLGLFFLSHNGSFIGTAKAHHSPSLTALIVHRDSKLQLLAVLGFYIRADLQWIKLMCNTNWNNRYK